MKNKPTYIKDIENSVKTRKKGKEFFDSAINLSNSNKGNDTLDVCLSSSYQEGKKNRLLDEGAITYEGGEDIRLYIKKGCIQSFYDSLPDDYVGYINLAHIDITALPLNLGTWTKKDLSIVDIGDGRKALDVNVKLNKKLNIVQDLLNQEVPLSLSAELTGDLDWNATFKFNAPFYDTIQIKGFSIVANPANVNSASISLNSKGENMNLLEFLTNRQNNQAQNAEVNKNDKENEENLENKDEGQEDPKQEPNAEAVELTSENVQQLGKLMDQFEEMKAQIEKLESENKELKEKLETAGKDKTELEKKVGSTFDRLNALLSSTPKPEGAENTNVKNTGSMWG